MRHRTDTTVRPRLTTTSLPTVQRRKLRPHRTFRTSPHKSSTALRTLNRYKYQRQFDQRSLTMRQSLIQPRIKRNISVLPQTNPIHPHQRRARQLTSHSITNRNKGNNSHQIMSPSVSRITHSPNNTSPAVSAHHNHAIINRQFLTRS